MNNSINKWQESISALPEKQFFNLIRLYIGEVKTPFNKHQLISELASFIRTPENISAILTLLDSTDAKFISAISIIPNASIQVLADFFKTEFTYAEVVKEVLNLSERLLVYLEKNQENNKETYHINPFLEENLKPFINLNYILPKFECIQRNLEDNFSISPNFLCAFISYLKIQTCTCKADGKIRKNDLASLEEVFPGKTQLIQLLVTSFINLSLIHEGKKHLEVDNGKLELFSKLNPNFQYVLLCAASVSRFGREGLKKEAQLLLDVLSSIPESGYTRTTLLRLAYLMGTFTEDGSAIAKQSRFSKILENARNQKEQESFQTADILDLMIDSAIEFGLLQKLGSTEDNQDIFIKGSMISDAARFASPTGINSNEMPKVLNIESTFAVTLMPGLELNKLLPLTNFLMIHKCGVVTEFEITRTSASYAFDLESTPSELIKTLEAYTFYELPQNLKMNIQEWYDSYSSAMLYHGYILKVTEKNILLAENNPNIKKYIKEKLADGIYLLNIPANASAQDFINQSGLDFMGQVHDSKQANDNLAFPLLRNGRKPAVFSLNIANPIEENISKREDATRFLSELSKHLSQTDFNANQKEALQHRISNRLILSAEQLNKVALRNEILEANGMDFAGKVHMLENSIKENELMELQLPDAKTGQTLFTIIGHPLQLSKQPGDAVLRFQIEPQKEIQNIIVSRISHMKRLL